MTKDERSLLLYLETCIVDHDGRVNSASMNSADREIVAGWVECGFIEYGRIASEFVTRDGGNWVTFSDDAWLAAHKERRARGERMLAGRHAALDKAWGKAKHF